MSTTWESLNPGDYISANDFNGKDVTLTIIGVGKQEFEKEDGSGHETRGVVAFKQTSRKWVLNKTNIQLLRAIWPSVEDSIGHAVTLMPEKVKFGKEWVLGIRVKGSPDLDKPVDVAVKLPKRKAVNHKLIPTKKGEEQPLPEPETTEGECPNRDADACEQCKAEGNECSDARGPFDEDTPPW